MAIQNINTIQNHNDLAYILNNANEYMYESLSNLGQRYSLKGDGITNHSFTIKSLLSYTTNNDDDYNLLAKLVVINDKLVLELYNISNNFELVHSEEIKYTINNAIFTDTNIKLNQKINGVDYYNENMLIYSNNSENTLNIASIGSDNELGIIEMNIESYDIQHNILLESLKLININSDKYYLYYLSVDKASITSKLNQGESPIYYLKIAEVDIDYINKLYIDFAHFVTFVYNNIVLEYYKEFKTIGLSINNIYYEIIQIGFNEIQNTNNNYIFNVSLNNSQEGFYSNDVPSVVHNNVLHYIYNQYIHMYSFIFEYYCNYIYKLDNKQLNRYLIYSLYLEIFKKSGKNLINGFGIYLPLNYTIDYFCKNNDQFYIYSNETPLNVLYTNKNLTFDYVKNFFGFVNNKVENNKIILASADTFETIILYKFSIEYNNKYENIINNIVFSELYSTPYISDDYWVINGIKTVYKAIGEDAGNPNIIIVYTNILDNNSSNFIPNKDYLVLSSIHADNLNTTMWTKKTVNIELQQKINNDVDEIFSHNFLVPTNIPEKYNKLYENALIINLSNINNINNTLLPYKIQNIKNYLGANSFVTTFWIYKNGNFNCIYKPTNTNVALTLLDISNVENIISSTIDKQIESKSDLDNYTFNKITLKSSYTTTKNDLELEETTNYLISLKNYTANEQLKNITIEDIYNNNLMLKLNVDITTNSNSIISSKFLQQYFISSISFNNLYYPENKVYNTDISEYKSYLPKNNVPILNLSNYLVTNANNVNRINLLTFPNNSDGTPYYSYIGIGNDKLNELHIGSKSTPLSLTTLANEDDIKNLSVQDTLSFDFEKIKFNAVNISNNINYTYSYTYTENDEQQNKETTISTYTSNFNIPIYHITTNTAYSHIDLTNGTSYIQGNVLTTTNTYMDNVKAYVNNKFNEINYVLIKQSYILNLIEKELELKETTNFTVSENINKVGHYKQNEEGIEFYYYVAPYNPITYMVELTVNTNLYLNKINILFNGSKLLPFEITENKIIEKENE